MKTFLIILIVLGALALLLIGVGVAWRFLRIKRHALACPREKGGFEYNVSGNEVKIAPKRTKARIHCYIEPEPLAGGLPPSEEDKGRAFLRDVPFDDDDFREEEAKKPSTTIHELHQLQEMTEKLKAMNETHVELSYNASRELKRLIRTAKQLDEDTEKARKKRLKEKRRKR